MSHRRPEADENNMWNRNSSHQHNRSIKGLSSSLSIPSTFSSVKSGFSGFSMLSFDGMKNFQDKINEEIRIVNAENTLLEKYLYRLQPYSVSDIQKDLTAAQEVVKRVHKMASRMSTVSSGNMAVGSSASLRPTLPSTRSGTLSTSMFRLTVTFRSELVSREMEETKQQINQLKSYCKKTKFRINTELEQIELMTTDMKLAKSYFKQNVIEADTIETGRNYIPAEKYLKHIQNLINSCDQNLGKTRLKVSTLCRSYSILKTKLQQASELGETTHPVDFEELKIENKEHCENLDLKNKYLMQLKKVTGQCSLNFNAKRRYLDDLKDKLDRIKEEIRRKEILLAKHENDVTKTSSEVSIAKKENSSILDVVTYYKAPSVIDYAKTKSTLRELQKSIKLWTRRVKVQETTINALKDKLIKTKGNYDSTDNIFNLSGRRYSNEFIPDDIEKFLVSALKNKSRKSVRKL